MRERAVAKTQKNTTSTKKVQKSDINPAWGKKEGSRRLGDMQGLVRGQGEKGYMPRTGGDLGAIGGVVRGEEKDSI